MLPDIKKPSGIRKSTQMSFGGIDLRPEAADGTFSKTINMTSDKSPVMASRAKRRAVYNDGQIYGCDMIGMGDGVYMNVDGFQYYNGIEICTAERQGGGKLIPFGNKIIIPWTREIVDLTVIPKGRKSGQAALPQNAAEGDAWLLPNQSEVQTDPDELWVRKDGAWVNTGPIIKSLEDSYEINSAVIRSGTYQGEKAANNTIEIINFETMVSGSDLPDFTKHFKVGDAVTIHTGIKEFDQTLVVREVTETQLRFYENSFQNLVGRYTVPDFAEWDDQPTIGPGLYQVTGWDRFEYDLTSEDPLQYFIIPSGTTLTKGMYIEYRYQDCQFNPNGHSHNYAEIKLFKADGTELPDVTVTPVDSYDAATYPDGPTELFFETVDCGEDLFFGVLYITVSRKWPEGLKGLFANANRLWGWCGHQIRCSKLGDPSNWEFFDGTAEDAWAVDVHDPDRFTGGISVHGYPTFFTENKRYRVYGSEPEAFQLGEQDCNGVREGCAKSMVAFDGALYYVSRVGIMQDTGAAPVCVSEALGLLRLKDAVAGGYQKRYYVTGKDEAGTRHNLVLDTRNGVWIDEGSLRIDSYAAAGGVMHAAVLHGIYEDDLTIWAYGSGSPMGSGTEEGTISSVLETNDYTMNYPNRKRVHRVQLRFVLGSGASLAVAIQYDGDGTWHAVKTITGEGGKRSVYLPVIPRRCDHFRLKFTGSGEWELYSLALDLRQGSAGF